MARGGCAGEGVELGDELLRGHGVFRIAFGEIDPCLVSDPLNDRRPIADDRICCQQSAVSGQQSALNPTNPIN